MMRVIVLMFGSLLGFCVVLGKDSFEEYKMRFPLIEGSQNFDYRFLIKEFNSKSSGEIDINSKYLDIELADERCGDIPLYQAYAYGRVDLGKYTVLLYTYTPNKSPAPGYAIDGDVVILMAVNYDESGSIIDYKEIAKWYQVFDYKKLSTCQVDIDSASIYFIKTKNHTYNNEGIDSTYTESEAFYIKDGIFTKFESSGNKDFDYKVIQSSESIDTLSDRVRDKILSLKQVRNSYSYINHGPLFYIREREQREEQVYSVIQLCHDMDNRLRTMHTFFYRLSDSLLFAYEPVRDQLVLAEIWEGEVQQEMSPYRPNLEVASLQSLTPIDTSSQLFRLVYNKKYPIDRYRYSISLYFINKVDYYVIYRIEGSAGGVETRVFISPLIVDDTDLSQEFEPVLIAQEIGDCSFLNETKSKFIDDINIRIVDIEYKCKCENDECEELSKQTLTYTLDLDTMKWKLSDK